MTDWHAPEDLVARYADGSLPDPDAWSLEKHLEACTPCAARVSRSVRATAAGAVLSDVRRTVLSDVRRTVLSDVRRTALATPETPAAPHRPLPAPPPVPLPRIRVLWAAGPAVRGAWLPAALLVAVGAVVLAHGAGFAGARPLLLALAPVVPLAGVALSYGAHADPLHELAASTPSAGLRLVLTRTAVVLVVSLPLLTLAGLLLPSYGGPGAAAWLLPGLALTLASLALGGWLGLRTATAVTGGGWLCAVLAPALAPDDGAVSAALTRQASVWLGGAPAQGAWAAAAVLCATLLAARRTAYDRLERH
ncbi:zf-HC2 domain-containing protein [Streptomyces sp. NPDC057806]|uniref:zf-HC2 domain-containing protein n=1 Tax=Streptomyces sp. NPDC057806 TaxID=3346255 RepID=UPI0036D163CF